MKYFLIAGEASGDLHGAHLVRAIKDMDSEANIQCWGGDKMQEAGAKVCKHIRELAFMGFVEVLLNLPQILKNFKLIKQQILSFEPDMVIFIDYPGFNLRMAEWTHKQGIQNAYYIAPQVWAWKENRVHKMRKYIDQLYVILPFEKEYFESHDIDTRYVGHPLLEGITDKLDGLSKKTNDRKIVALLPGSRKQEIEKMLPVMIKALESFPDTSAIIAGAPNMNRDFYHKWTKTNENISLLENKTYDLLGQADYALVTSGTATLETALFQVPQIVLYKGNWISYQIARRIVNLDYISLVNLIMNREVVKELIQNDFNTKTLKKEFKKILEKEHRNKIFKDYFELEQKLGGKGASEKTAQFIVKSIQKPGGKATRNE